MMMGQHWFDKTKPKQPFRLTQNAFKKLLRNFKKLFNVLTNELTNCLPDVFSLA